MRSALAEGVDMVWATRQYSKEEIDQAGSILLDRTADEATITSALAVINNWRSSHNFPLNTFQVTLRRHARDVQPDSIVAQRIKRLSSIEQKLRRFGWLKLSEMQDLGGCRHFIEIRATNLQLDAVAAPSDASEQRGLKENRVGSRHTLACMGE